MPARHADASAFLAALVRRPSSWDAPRDEVFVREFLDEARFHGVAPLLYESHHAGWPETVTRALRDASVAAAQWELGHQHILRGLLHALAQQCIEPLILKGTALAYGLYPNPVLRVRGDTDLLVSEGQRTIACDTLRAHGFRMLPAAAGEAVFSQATFVAEHAGGTHAIDLHWAFNNSPVVAQAFAYDLLRASSVTLPKLAPQARGCDDVDALMIACVHRLTHVHNPYYLDGHAHGGANRLIWLNDIALLVESLRECGHWDEFVARTRTRRVAAACADGLRHAATAFADETLLTAAESLRPAGPEPLDGYFRSSRLRQQWLDWRELDSPKRRLTWLCQTVVPPATYMRERYRGDTSWLPWLYVRRVVRGVLARIES